jgi:hypothetical protein
MLVQQTTTPLKGWAESNSGTSPSEDAGDVAIASRVELRQRTKDATNGALFRVLEV